MMLGVIVVLAAAQSLDNATQIGTWLLSAAAVLAGVYYFVRVFIRRPPIETLFISRKDFHRHLDTCMPRLSSLEQKLSSKADLDVVTDRMDHMHRELSEKIDALDIKRERSLAEIHIKVNTVAQDVAFIRGKME